MGAELADAVPNVGVGGNGRQRRGAARSERSKEGREEHVGGQELTACMLLQADQPLLMPQRAHHEPHATRHKLCSVRLGRRRRHHDP